MKHILRFLSVAIKNHMFQIQPSISSSPSLLYLTFEKNEILFPNSDLISLSDACFRCLEPSDQGLLKSSQPIRWCCANIWVLRIGRLWYHHPIHSSSMHDRPSTTRAEEEIDAPWCNGSSSSPAVSRSQRVLLLVLWWPLFWFPYLLSSSWAGDEAWPTAVPACPPLYPRNEVRFVVHTPEYQFPA